MPETWRLRKSQKLKKRQLAHQDYQINQVGDIKLRHLALYCFLIAEFNFCDGLRPNRLIR
jgi:hypothetical protein